MYVSAPGLVCSVGLDSESACVAMRAGISQFEELWYLDTEGRPLIGAPVPGIERSSSRAGHLLTLLTLAITETLQRLPPSIQSATLPVIVCLAENGRPGGGAHLAQHVVGALERELGIGFHPERSGAIAKGHVSGFRALRVARRLLQDSDIDACLICAVDSYLNASSLNWLDKSWRLKTEDNSDGVIPGEAAAAVAVSRRPLAEGQFGAAVRGLGFAREDATLESEEPLLGHGLANATREAMREVGLGLHDFDFRISDVAGESYAFRDLALQESRLMRVRREEQPVWHAADSIGDIGAAAGLFQLALAERAFSHGYADGDWALCCSAAPNGDRAVAALHRQRTTRAN